MGILCLVLAVSAAEPPRVQIVSAPDSIRVAETLRAELAREPRWSVAEQVAGALTAREEASELDAESAKVQEANDDYIALDAAAAVTKATVLLTSLMSRVDEPPAAQLAARAFRIKGLALLFLGQAPEAATAFLSASFLDPEFSPGAHEWPPEARLAYADAVAAGKGAVPGILSVRVEPESATVWLDGREVGGGPTTLPEIVPGEHLVLAKAPGYAPMAAAIGVVGDGKLTQAPLFLVALPEEQARPAAVNAFAAAVGSDGEAAWARRLAERLDVDHLVYVMTDVAPVAIAFDRDGERMVAEPIALGTDDGTARVSAALAGEAQTPPPDFVAGAGEGPKVITPPPGPIEEPEPLYKSWKLWVPIASAVVAIGGGIAIIYAVTNPPRNDNVTLYIGKRP